MNIIPRYQNNKDNIICRIEYLKDKDYIYLMQDKIDFCVNLEKGIVEPYENLYISINSEVVCVMHNVLITNRSPVDITIEAGAKFKEVVSKLYEHFTGKEL